LDRGFKFYGYSWQNEGHDERSGNNVRPASSSLSEIKNGTIKSTKIPSFIREKTTILLKRLKRENEL